MPMQTEQTELSQGHAPVQQPAQGSRTSMFGNDVYMGVSTYRHTRIRFNLIADSNQADPKTSSGEGYALEFISPKQSN